LIVFPKTYQETAAVWSSGAIAVVEGKIDFKGDEAKLIVEKAFVAESSSMTPESDLASDTSRTLPTSQTDINTMTIRLTSERCNSLILGQLQTLLASNPGPVRVTLVLHADSPQQKTITTEILTSIDPSVLISLERISGTNSFSLE